MFDVAGINRVSYKKKKTKFALLSPPSPHPPSREKKHEIAKPPTLRKIKYFFFCSYDSPCYYIYENFEIPVGTGFRTENIKKLRENLKKIYSRFQK